MTTKAQWIRSPGYDLTLVFGGAFLTLSLPLLATLSPVALIPLFFWMWVFFFEGSHFWATYSRTYMDARFRSEQTTVLYASLLFFAFPAIAVTAGQQTVYGFFIFLWSLVHNTRQHYGFVAIYSRKANVDEKTLARFRHGTYLATVGPMLHFALGFKLGGEFPNIASALPAQLATWLPWALTATSIIYAASLWNKGSKIAVAYIFNCILFYNVMFYGVAHMDGMLTNPQALLVVTIMNSLFHNIQYHAIVWHFSQKRYAESPGAFGLAQRINAKLPTYVLAALSFAAFFTLVFWWRGELTFFSVDRSVGMGNIAYVIYFGIVGHHFYLDQKIWKVSRTKELAGYFALQTQNA